MDNDDTLLLTLLDISRDVLLAADREARVVAVNQAFRELSGFPADDLIGRGLWSLFAEGENPGFLGQLQATLEEQGSWQGDLRLLCRGERVCRAEAEVRLVRGADGGPHRYLVFLRDIAQIAAGFDQERQRTQYDPLTKLPNRYLLFDRLERALIAARRSDQSVALLRVGLDHFNRVNDGLGHPIGDKVLFAVAQRLKHTVRRSDTVGRLEGDQFLLVMNMKSDDDAVIVAQKVLAAMHEPFSLDGHELSLTASVGITLFPADYDDAEQLLRASVSAMHHAKQTGRNGYQFYSHDMNSRAKQRLTLENDLRRALEENQLLLHYQPKVDAGSGRIVGAEALVRWLHPQRGLIPPGEFIPVAEESGLITALGEWVLVEACRQNASWQAAGLMPVRISVNAAPPQLRSETLSERVAEVLRETGLEATWLELEITESMLVGNPDLVAAKLRQLRDLGVHIAIDDFGTGYSSLSYLTRFPITTLKIDRSFVRDLETNASMAEVTRAIIGLSRGLDLEVVAEGAETAAHIAFLKDHGCATVQGFFYSKPVPAEAFEALLRVGVIRHEEDIR